jgi:hypothetical protein
MRLPHGSAITPANQAMLLRVVQSSIAHGVPESIGQQQCLRKSHDLRELRFAFL